MARLTLGFSRPRRPILGTELAGEIELVGKAVSKFKVGNQVFAFTGLGMGCYVEYKCIAEDGDGPKDGALALKPANLNYDEAAAMSFGGTTALGFFTKAKIQNGDTVLINGASGGVGTAAVQLAKHFGAEVTGVCSTGNLELVKSIGADNVIDYTTEDFTRNGETYDIIVDTAGTAPFSRSNRSLKEGGRLLMVLGTLPGMLQIPFGVDESQAGHRGCTRLGRGGPALSRESAESKQFKPVIDRRYTFEQMAEAHRYVDEGHKKGNVVVTL